MQFTPTETKLVARLQKQRRGWPKWRWLAIIINALLLLSLAVALIVCAVQEILTNKQQANAILSVVESGNSPDAKEAITLLATHVKGSNDVALISLTYLGSGIIFAGLAFVSFLILVRDWRGNAHSLLLLKLLEAQQYQESSNAQSSKQPV